MDIRKFTAGSIVKHSGHKVFHPERINHNYTWKSPELNTLLEKAGLSIGELNGLTQVPGSARFRSMFIAKQAHGAFSLEDDHITLEDSLLREDQVLPGDRDDWKKLNSFRNALTAAFEAYSNKPVSSRMLSELHIQLVDGNNNGDETAGVFRNAPAREQQTHRMASVWQDIPELMEDLLKFLGDKETEVPALIKIAIAHYQFNAIQPFTEANGRMSRILVPAYLVNSGILHQPYLLVTGLFKKHKDLYRQNLDTIIQKDKLGPWLKCFLSWIIEAAAAAIHQLKALHALKYATEQAAGQFGKKSPNALLLVDHLFEHPIVAASEVTRLTEVSKVSSYKLIEDFMAKGILRETRGVQRNRLFAFTDYLNLFK